MSRRNMTVGQIEELVENPGIPIRQPATAILTVDTADRLARTKVNDLYINKQETLVQGYFTRLALTELNFNWDIPNVNAYNNTMNLVFYYAPGLFFPLKISIAENFYGMADLATAVQNALNSAIAAVPVLAPLYTMNFIVEPENRQFRLVNTNGSAKKFGISPLGKVEKGSTDLCDVMGFATADPAVEANIVQSGYATMLYTPYFDIVSRQLTKKQNVRDSGTSDTTGQNLLARVYINPFGIVPNPAAAISPAPPEKDAILGAKPFTIHYEFQNPKQVYWDTKEFINVIDLQLLDNKGRVLYETPTELTLGGSLYRLGSGEANWQLTFQITET